MSHKNYNNYSKQFKTPEIQEVDVQATTSAVVETVEPEIEPTIDATIPEPEAYIEPPVIEAAPELPKVTGIVNGCNKLNVRNRPNITAGILTTITNGTEVEIAQPVVDGDFYKVTLANGIVGYCMKKFIVVK